MDIINNLTGLALRKLEFLDRGETYIVYSTYDRLKLGYLAKSHNLQILSCGMFTDNLDLKTSRKLFKSSIEIRDVMLDPDLGLTVLNLVLYWFIRMNLLVLIDQSIHFSYCQS